jgi:tetratricopeptide (TPR) repeat protein
MKKTALGFAILVLVAAYAAAQNNSEDDEPAFTTESETMTIKVVGPGQPIVAPSENERAMRAYTTGTRLLQDNRLEEAERYLKEAIDLDPLFVDAMDHLGMVYRRQNRLDEAEEMYLRSIAINDRNIVPYQNLAIVYKLKNRLNDAFELYKKMIDIDKDNPEPYYGIGELFYTVGDYTTSMLFFDKAIELYIAQNSPWVYDAFYYKGLIHYQTGNYEEALLYLEEARKGDTNHTVIDRIIDEIKSTVPQVSGPL